MSELKATTVYDAYWKANSTGEGTGILVYLKSEADKVITEKDEKIDELEERIDELQKATDSAWSKVNVMYDEIRHHKYKRCLAMAKWCMARYNEWAAYYPTTTTRKIKFLDKWHKRWREIAEKFKDKEAK